MQAMQAMQARRGRFPGVEEEHVRSIILFSGAKGLVALCCSSAKPDTYHRTWSAAQHWETTELTLGAIKRTMRDLMTCLSCRPPDGNGKGKGKEKAAGGGRAALLDSQG
eukprot:scaffold2724_cov260-Pinguiococcus_pyrenoidosus.AAC.13